MFNIFKSNNIKKSKQDYDLVIDVRNKEEFSEGNIKNSKNISLDKIESAFKHTELFKIDRNKKILLICRSGGRAGIAKEILEEEGFTNVDNGGSWKNWK
ncbi:MAG: rhodanese-like domain-containing protein [Candidatus Pacebacteria bacterium]|nr:rhodanese-like domain-containing protein [Candidatus Paceibacterota bacterium]